MAEVLQSCSHAAFLFYCFSFSYSSFQTFSTSSLFGGSTMVIRFPCSSSKSFYCVFIKSLFCWYCFCLLWYLESLLLRAYKRCLGVSSKVGLVCSSAIWYFVFIEFVFLFIFDEGLGSFICDILLISAQTSFIRRFILNIQSPILTFFKKFSSFLTVFFPVFSS